MVHKQNRSAPVMRAVVDAVAERLKEEDETLLRIPEVCAATGVNYGSVYHHFGSREGVIDAAYEMMFAEIVAQDIAMVRGSVQSTGTFEEFVAFIGPLLHNLSSGDARRSSRGIRLRVLAASVTRPRLRRLIGEAQARLTAELTSVVELCQERGWIRRDLPAVHLAVLLQVVIFGRNLDDASRTPMSEAEWEQFMFGLFQQLMLPTD